MITIEAIKKLNAERTQGEWSMYYEGSGDFCIVTERGKIAHSSKEYGEDNEICTASGTDSCMMGGEKTERDANFIIAAPDIANLAIQLDEENKALLQQIESNGIVYVKEINRLMRLLEQCAEFKRKAESQCFDNAEKLRLRNAKAETVDSEREMNAIMTEENKRLRNTLMQVNRISEESHEGVITGCCCSCSSYHEIIKVTNEALQKEPKCK